MSDVHFKAKEVMQDILWADFKMNGYARSYFGAFERAEAEYGENGVKTQILYFFNNVRAKTEKQKIIKFKLMKFANQR